MRSKGPYCAAPSRDAFQLIGLAMRAGRCVYGAAACENALRKGAVQLLVMDGGLAAGTKERFERLCVARRIRVAVAQAPGALGRSIGKENIKIVGVTDSGFGRMILKSFEEGPEGLPGE